MRDPLSTTIAKPTPKRRAGTIAVLVGAAIVALILATLTARPRERTYNEELDVEIIVTEPGQPLPQGAPAPPRTAP
jgi:hypothetical protein